MEKVISNKYLGKFGIHSVGIRPSLNAVSVFMDPDYDDVYAESL
jgi:hypothetical protein